MNLPELARKTIESYFKNEQFQADEATTIKYKNMLASFVTLTRKGKLRGCIGSLIATRPLFRDVQENAINAAFQDQRFPELIESELEEIKIEVSILTQPRKIEFKSPQELLEKIDSQMGLVLKKGFSSSTFLPQVWEQIPDKIAFLEQLSLKAGLPKDTWKTSEIRYYTVDIEKED